MDNGGNRSHTKWQGKYHVVFISEVPKKDAGGWVYGERKRNLVGQHFWPEDTSCRR